MSNPKLNFKEETSAKKTRSPPKKARVEQSTPKKKKLKLDADKAAEKNQHSIASDLKRPLAFLFTMNLKGGTL